MNQLAYVADVALTLKSGAMREPRCRVRVELLTAGDFSSNRITSGLPTTRTSALTLYAS